MRRILNWIFIGLVVIGIAAAGSLAINNYMRLDVLNNLGEFNLDEPVSDELLLRATMAIEEAEQAVDLAFNLLGLFEALSLAITIGGVVLTAFGLTRFTTARNELEEARRVVEKELENARERFDTALAEREAELKTLRTELQQTAVQERQRTSDALLANALIPLAERQYKTADYKGAIDTYNRALTLDPLNPVTNQRLGYVYTQSGQLELAKEHYERAIELEKDLAPALAGLGFVYRRFGEQVGNKLNQAGLSDDAKRETMLERDRLLNRAEHLLLQALTLSPKLVDDDGESYWGILGGLYKRRGQIDQAIEAYRKVTELTPQSSYGYGNLALLYQKKNDREKMRETYEIVERIASKEAEAEAGNFWGYSDLIVSSYAIGKVQQADASLPIAIAIAPQDSPYMLEGLVDTLRELEKVMEPDEVAPIQKAIERLENEMAQREYMKNSDADEDEDPS